ncbi:hypothetical protein LTR56_025583 [Elasticomyces elasticus]|nr:hypothetical protein LTR56_025583 [Elasticomyces elasticus]KAK3617912.1 hypothetical protein LTR22_026567 [Elasticomyces elasticus]KAK4902370.1 hypothetical protein LTR49_027110 [Elasticomyces elasticus]KAK5739848.1 hypothetical protein LTS12_025143 [Elasticomyces elasticus]
MEPGEAYHVDRQLFDNELTNLIKEYALAAIPMLSGPAKITTALSVSDPRSKRRRNNLAVETTRQLPSAGELYTVKSHARSQDGSSLREIAVPRRCPGRGSYKPASHHEMRIELGPATAARHFQNLPSPDHPALRSPTGLHDDFSRPYKMRKTWTTVRNAVRRQDDPYKDDMAYEALLELRRNEKIENVDRYVPDPTKAWSPPRPLSNIRTERIMRPLPIVRHQKPFQFEKLPEPVQARILSYLLVSPWPVKLDFSWLRSFFTGHARVPTASNYSQHDAEQAFQDVQTMEKDMEPFKAALEQRADKACPQKSPCVGLTTSTLLVSRAMHNVAARVLYEQNTFSFPSATSAWMLLESFLVTIGANNVGRLRSLQIHIPLWRHGVNHDYIEGAIVDLASPVSRLAVIRPPARDRLLSAIKHCVHALQEAGELTTFEPRIARLTGLWTGQNLDSTSFLDEQDCDARKQKGAKLLKGLALSTLKGNQPVLDLSHLIRSTESTNQDAIKRLLDLREEAAEYGWQVLPPTSRHDTAAVPAVPASSLHDSVAMNPPLAQNGLGRSMNNEPRKRKKTRR